MAVTLDGTTLSHILDFLSEETTSVSIHGWVNEGTVSNNVDTDVWNRELERIFINCRVSDDDKDTIETSADGLATVTLSVNAVNYTVWIHRIGSHYEGDINATLPWRLDIELIISD